jgi:hypothetical protein
MSTFDFLIDERAYKPEQDLSAVPVLAEPQQADSPTQKRGQDDGGEARESNETTTQKALRGDSRGGGQNTLPSNSLMMFN